MSMSVALAKRDTKMRDLRSKLDSASREHASFPMGMNGAQSAYLIERRKMLMVLIREVEDEMAELAYLEGAALEARFDPAPQGPPAGVNPHDALYRGQRISEQVVVSVNGRPV